MLFLARRSGFGRFMVARMLRVAVADLLLTRCCHSNSFEVCCEEFPLSQPPNTKLSPLIKSSPQLFFWTPLLGGMLQGASVLQNRRQDHSPVFFELLDANGVMTVVLQYGSCCQCSFPGLKGFCTGSRPMGLLRVVTSGCEL